MLVHQLGRVAVEVRHALHGLVEGSQGLLLSEHFCEGAEGEEKEEKVVVVGGGEKKGKGGWWGYDGASPNL
jgi:hypothetical protein